MSLTELWHLFPIQLVEHRAEWADFFKEEKRHLHQLLTDTKIIAIHHIGSTAIKGICAKPIVDILVELDGAEDMTAVSACLETHGYRCMCRSEKRISLNKGYTPEGYADKVFHIHLRYKGDHPEIFFRDYLNANRNESVEYEKLKLFLSKQYEFDRDGYTSAKSAFIHNVMKQDQPRFSIRKAVTDDIPRMLEIFSTARKFMAAMGNPNQWAENYPGEKRLLDDIESGDSHVCLTGDRMVATFLLRGGKDPTYNTIYEGQWPDDAPYATIHRIASNGEVKGVFHRVIEFALKHYDTLRIDTHRDNKVMQNAVLKESFRYCGVIHCWNGEERLAYQLKKKNR